MERYRNTSGNSGVYSYEIGNDYIRVQFSSGQTYRYSYKKAGNHNVEKIKTLARNGSGLNAYINNYVKFKYD
jgi:hypothetical protein